MFCVSGMAILAPLCYNMHMSIITKTLRAERIRRGRTLADVAAEVGISVAYLADIERGRRATFDGPLEAVNRVLRCYGLEVVVEVRPIEPE